MNPSRRSHESRRLNGRDYQVSFVLTNHYPFAYGQKRDGSGAPK